MIRVLLPMSSAAMSASSLDYRMLGEVRVGALTLLNILHEDVRGPFPIENPVVDMWRGYELFLCSYATMLNDAWSADPRVKPDMCKPYRDHIDRHWRLAEEGSDTFGLTLPTPPPWYGREDIMESDRSELLRENYPYYSIMFPETPLDVPPAWMRLRSNVPA